MLTLEEDRMSNGYDSMPAFHEESGELLGSDGEDYVVLSAEALRRINRQEEATLGSGSHVIWYNAGKAVGKKDGQKYAHLMKTMEVQDLADYLKETYTRYGWGSVWFAGVDVASGELLFTVRNSPLARGIRSKEPRCWFVRGFVEGLTSELLGTECIAAETACQTVNGRQCEFRLSWDSGISK
jgi:predicted hydrocarbon binding protein